MGRRAARISNEAEGSFIVGPDRWHYCSVKQSDYYFAKHEGLVVSAGPARRLKERLAKKAEELSEAEMFAELLAELGPMGRERLARIEQATCIAGFLGLSDAAEPCAHAEEEGHHCVRSCFPSFEANRLTKEAAEHDPVNDVVYVGKIPADVMTGLYRAIENISSEGGRVAERVRAFRGVGDGAAAPPPGEDVRVPAVELPSGSDERERAPVDRLVEPGGGDGVRSRDRKKGRDRRRQREHRVGG